MSRNISTGPSYCHLLSHTWQVRLAWNIFFPTQIKPATSKEEVKKRLRMVLVADRCGMSPASLTEMKKTIVTALQARGRAGDIYRHLAAING